MSKIYFFRHAQASFGKANYDELSQKGEEQSKLLGKYLVKKKISFDQIYVGPLKRQQHTFQLVNEVYENSNITIPKAVILPELAEHQGTEAMRLAIPKLKEENSQIKVWLDEIQANPKLMGRNTMLSFQLFLEEWAVGKYNSSDVQNWSDFRVQVQRGLAHILEQTISGQTIGVFTSGGTISSIVAESLDLKNEKRVAALNFSIRNTSYSSFLYSKNQFNLLSFNELPHLEKEMITFV